MIRLPIAWERLQPTLGGPLNASELGQIQRVVSYANSLGVAVDLDLHNYADYNGQPIGSAAVPVSAFVNLWSPVAAQFAGSNVLFGLMNEPALDSNTWLSAQNSAIAAIRAAGATSQTVLVSGIDYDSASTWLSSGNAATYGHAIVDPSNNYAFEMHQYFDSNGSGVGGDTVSPTIGEQDLAAATEWANQNHARLFLGEFGSNTDSVALANLQNTLAYMAGNVWLGATEWEASTSYNYYFNVAPVNGVDSPQITVLDKFAPGATAAPTPVTTAAAPTPVASVAAAGAPATPTIAGIAAQTLLNDRSTATPFAGIAVADATATATTSAALTLSAAGSPSDANGVLSGAGLTHTGAGSYSLAATSPQTLSAELAALVFTPTAHEAAPGSTITSSLAATVTSADAASATATTNLAVTVTDTAPTVTGLAATVGLTDSSSAAPFSAVTVTDPDFGAATSATITLTASGAASDADGTLSGAGLAHIGAGTYSLAAVTPAALTAELQGLAFLPAGQGAAGATTTTGVSLAVAEGYAVTQAASSIVTTDAGPPVTSVTVNLSEDAYGGDAQCTVSIDGKQVGGLQTITALHAQGHYDALTFTGAFGVGSQAVAVSFVNDAYGGSPGLDRNLYVDSVAVNGAAVGGTAASLYSNGTAGFTAAAPQSSGGVVAPTLANPSGVTETIVAH